MWEDEVWLHSFLISALDGGEWPVACPCLITLRGKITLNTIKQGIGGSQCRSEA